MPRVNEREKVFSDSTSKKLLKAIRDIAPISEDTHWTFTEIFEDKGLKRIDKEHELEAALSKLNFEIREFRKIAIKYWKQYHSYAAKGL